MGDLANALARRLPRSTPVPAGADLNASMRTASLTAGLGLLAMAPLGVFGYLVVINGLVTPGDAAQTAADVAAARALFGLGVGSLMGVIVLDVLVAFALYRLLRPVSRRLAALAAGFRLVYAVVFMAAVSRLVQVWVLVGGDAALTDEIAARMLAEFNTFQAVWDAGLVLFGLHLIVIGYLAYHAVFVPKVLAVLVTIAGIGYAYDSLAPLWFSSAPLAASSITFVGELLLAFWLVFLARRSQTKPRRSRPADRIEAQA
jgi:hypothetical protein